MPDRLLPNPVLATRLHLIEWVRWGMVADLAVTGLGFALGPASWSSASGYAVIHALPIPVSVWGWAWTVAAVLIVAGRRWIWCSIIGHAFAAAVFVFWGIALAVPLVFPPVTGWGGPWHHLTLGGIHLWLAAVGVFDWAYPLRRPWRVQHHTRG